MKDDLPPKFLAVLKFVKRHISKTGRAPSVKEIAEGLGRCKATIGGRLCALEWAGHITRDPNRPRSIRITRKGEALP